MSETKPYLWMIDSARKPLADCLEVFEDWAGVLYIEPGQEWPNWEEAPDAVFFSAEIEGGATGDVYLRLREAAGDIPLLAVARLRSLTQALAFFRAGAADYLPLPLDEDEARERLAAALDRVAERAMAAVMVELEPLDPESDLITNLEDVAAVEAADILAQLAEETLSNEDAPEDAETVEESPALPESAGIPESAEPPPEAGEDAEPVDGLPIPTLWEELPCGLLVFDSAGNLVFANSLGLDLFGHASLADLQETLENNPASFAAHAANHKPLADNQWPQALARRTRTARSAVLSVEKPDRRRVWLRIDCLPHLAEGRITRLSMTVVNLTGELPPLAPAPETPAPPQAKRDKAKKRGKRRGMA